ncbi:hypothetical protein [Occallatibacter savannae]|uniref:hypothetical protein n=1 Tax=Occallatibacter savannae TaxID=1002691 RepID=UPI000D69D2E1|nr:hypothetical protein [Occallatibacter savannae]
MQRLFAVILLILPVACAQTPMQRIASLFSDRWTIVDRSVSSDGHSKEPSRKGEERWYTLGAGAPLIEEYRSQSLDGTWEYDTAAILWDATLRKYRGVFCADFLDHGCDPFEVDWPERIGHLIVMSGSYTQKGKVHRWREEFDFSSHTQFTQSLYIAEAESDLKLVASILAIRVPGTSRTDVHRRVPVE